MYLVKLFLVFFVLLFCHGSFAQGLIEKRQIEAQLEQHTSRIDNVEQRLSSSDEIKQATLLEIREQIHVQRGQLQQLKQQLDPILNNTRSEINDLGPVPTGETAEIEPENVKKQRKLLTEEALAIEGLQIMTDALLSKSGRLLIKVTTLRREKFINRFFETQTSAFDSSLWTRALSEYKLQFAELPAYFDKKIDSNLGLISALIFLFIVVLIAHVISKKQLATHLLNKQQKPLSSVALSLMGPVISIALGIGAIYLALVSQSLLTEDNVFFVHRVLLIVAFLLSVLLITSKLKSASLIRSNSQWLINLAALIFTTDTVVLSLSRLTSAPILSLVAQSYISSTLFAIILAVLSTKVIRRQRNREAYLIPLPLFWVLAVLAFAILVANLFGYAALGRFIFERTVMFGSLIVFSLLIRALAAPFFNKLEQLFQNDHQSPQQEQQQEKLITFWLTLSLDIVLLFISLPLIALMMGTEWNTIINSGLQLFHGFKLGAVTISLSNIIIAVGLFICLLFLTRLIQKVLSQKILPNTKINISAQQSVIQIAGYIGLIIALLIAVSSIGFDLSNLALIAGALSVGIGFGLQSIVSNFVSGLILLFERPIKIGDWIITDSGEGIVKKINVRATEIETFDRTSIIIPNAELISSSVKNWTLKDKIGRAIVTVGVSYNSDPHQVQQILTDYAAENPTILNFPEPKVLFMDFADSALLFELRFFIRDISERLVVTTQVRLDIWDRFKAADIEIAFPQQDIHIRTAPGLAQVLNNKES